MDLLRIARQYLAAGFSLIPVLADGSKAPAVTTWNAYRTRRPTEAELVQWFDTTGEVVGVAIVCGHISGELEVLDFDDPLAWEAWQQDPSVKAANNGTDWRSLPRVRTPSGGIHIYLRRDHAGGNRKLAKDESGHTLIEVKAEGGYVLAPGCPPECHLSKGEYVWEVPLPLADGVA